MKNNRPYRFLQAGNERPADGVAKIHKMMDELEGFEARNAIKAAWAVKLKAELYLPQAVISRIASYTNKLDSMEALCRRETRVGCTSEEIREMRRQLTELQGEIKSDYTVIINDMKKYLIEEFLDQNEN